MSTFVFTRRNYSWGIEAAFMESCRLVFAMDLKFLGVAEIAYTHTDVPFFFFSPSLSCVKSGLKSRL